MIDHHFLNRSDQLRQGLSKIPEEATGVSSNAPGREFANLLLANWKTDPDLKGGRLISILCPQSLEVEVRSVGEIPEISPGEIRSSLLTAAETTQTAWECDPTGLGYPIRFEEKLLGLCILYPNGDVHPLSLWEQAVESYAERVGPLQTPDQDGPPSLEDLASAIPDRIQSQNDDSGSKLHWENSDARVEVPVQEELAENLLLDHMPLF